MKKEKRPYKAPALKTETASTAPVLLACTGQFDCIDFGGSESCCISDPSDCPTTCP